MIDNDRVEALECAVHQLSIDRAPLNEGHAGLRLHVLASLIAQAEALLPDAVADARDLDFDWSEIAAELGVTTSTARRYRRHAQTRRPPLERTEQTPRQIAPTPTRRPHLPTPNTTTKECPTDRQERRRS